MEIPISQKTNRPLLWILALLTGGSIILGVYIYRIVESPSPNQEINQLTQPATVETLSVEIEASGKVEPIQNVNISPKNPGRLARLLVDQGMKVKQGQVLAVMENREIQAQGFQVQARLKEAIANFEAAKVRIPGEIAQVEAQLNQVKARYNEAVAKLKQSQASIPKDVEQAQSQLRAAESRYKLAEARAKRNEALVKEGAISQDDFDAVVNEYLNAKANLLESLQRLEQVKNTAPPEIAQLEQNINQLKAQVQESEILLEQKKRMAKAEMDQLKAAVEATQGELEEVKIQFQDTVIRAPFDGIITQRFASEGAFVTPTTSASSTASATSSSILALATGLKVIARVPEVDLSLLKIGQPVNIVADAYPDQVFQGQVVRIAPEAIVDQNVTSFEVKVILLNGQEKLLSKMNVDVTFLGQQLNNALVVPTVAIVTQEGETGVYVPDKENENKPKFIPVKIGLVLDDKTQILSGLTQGQRVFTDLPETPDKDQKNK
jgi:HlyD family secretion protein